VSKGILRRRRGGLISRVHRLPLFRSKDKLKTPMIGSVLLEGVGEVTLTLEDFVTGEKIATRAIVCPMSNAGMVGALKKMQMVLLTVFSDAFENCLEAFIDNLEGIYRPMELVAADFLKHMVEITVRRFFRVVRSVKTSSTQQSLATPQKCADFLTASFDKVTEVLSDHPLMVKQEVHFRLQSARRGEAAVTDRAESVRSDTAKTEKQPVKFAEVSPETKKRLPQRTCSAYLGS
jgi:hypothetical protein